MMKIKIFYLIICTFALCLLWNPMVEAEQYPTKNITFIAPFGPGGMGDVTGRIVTRSLEKHLGQSIVFINKPGGFAVIGLSELAKAKPDGYTIGNTDDGPVVLVPRQREVPYSLKDFVLIGAYVKQELLIYSNLNKPWTSLEELFEYSKKTPITVGSSGDWELMICKVIAATKGLKWRFVAMKSGGETGLMALGGHVDLCTSGTGTPADLAARDGKLRRMLILTNGHLPEDPDLKNVEDLGYDFYQSLHRFVIAPAGISEPIRRKLEEALEKSTKDPEFVSSIEKLSIKPIFINGADSKRLLGGTENSVSNLLKAYSTIKD